MAYQNNNNRIVPNEIVNIKLNPQAAPTNQEIKYQPDLSEAKRTAGLADSLVKLGQGVLDMDYILQRKAEDSIIAAELTTKAQGQNMREWANVSKNVQGMAKFNPYIHDAYKRFTAKDLSVMAAIKVSSHPDILNGKWSSEQVNKYMQDTTAELLDAYKQSGLQPNDYGAFLEDYYKQTNNVLEHYTVKNADYNYNNSLTAMAHDTTLKMYEAITNNSGGDAIQKQAAMRDVLENTIAQCEALGIPADEIGTKVLATHLSEFIMQNPDLVNSENINQVLSGLTVYGKDFNEIIPNFSYQMHQVLVQARNAQFADREYELRNKELTIKMNSYDANAELYNFYKANPNATAEQWASQINQTIGKYGLQEVGIDFIKAGLADANTISEYMMQNTDPTVFSNLSAKAFIGELSPEEIKTAYENKTLSFTDGVKLMNFVNKEARQDNTNITQAYNQFSSMIKQQTFKTLGTGVTNDLQLKADNIVNEWKQGKITADEAQQQMKALNQRALNIQKVQQGNVNYSQLLNPRFLNSQQTPVSTRAAATTAFKQLGFVRSNMGYASGNITSMPDEQRGNRKHQGYDVTGYGVYNTHADGVVESAGYLSDLGNYIIIKYANGSRVRMGHLNENVSSWQGKKILANQYIAHVGNTGHSTGAHVDFRFMSKQGALCSAETFIKGLR